MNEEKILQAGKIISEVKIYARSFIKKGTPLLEIAEKIEARIVELGGKPAFPTSLGIDNITAHFTPSHDDKTLAHGLLKVDLGAHIDGWTADTAFSLDLEDNEENKKIIAASDEALKKALEIIKEGISTEKIGSTIQETIESFGFSPVVNLSGHSIEQYELHAGITIPNIGNKGVIELAEGLYAIEPFATNGSGRIRDGRPSGVYYLQDERNVRSPIAREALKIIQEKYNTLPFCSRWLVKEMGTKALFGLKQLEENGNLHHFTQLVEVQGSKVSQSEQTVLISKNKVTVTTA